MTVSCKKMETCPVNYWNMNWIKPDQSEILSIKDSQGEITNYTVNDNLVKIRTNFGRKRSEERIKIHSKVKDAVNSSLSPLKWVDLSLSGFDSERTYIEFKNPRILSGYWSQGYNSQFTNDSLLLNGTGAVNFRPVYYQKNKSDFEEKYERYDHFFLVDEFTESDYQLGVPENLYKILPGITGFKINFKRLPVIVLPDDTYERIGDKWSAGAHRRGGIILIKESSLKKKSGASVVLHEAMHSYNEFALRWDQTKTQWFNEGTAKFVEYIVNNKLGVIQAEVFGEEKNYVKGSYKYELPPRETLYLLSKYYDQKFDLINYWTPNHKKNRRFGYAFFELFIRKYAAENDVDQFRRVYQELLSVNKTIGRRSSKNEIILDALNVSKVAPCNKSNLSEMESCLDQVRNHSFEINSFNRTETSQTIQIPNEVSVEELETFENPVVVERINQDRFDSFLEGYLKTLESFFRFTVSKISAFALFLLGLFV